ncbi:RNA-directed DNA polymerase, partial [Kitasatospora sp. NPDC001175]
PQEWEQWLRATRTAVRENAITIEAGRGTSDGFVAFRLIHVHCHRWRGGNGNREPALLAARGPSGPA